MQEAWTYKEEVITLRDLFRSQRAQRSNTHISGTSMYLPTTTKKEKTEFNSVTRPAFIQFLNPLITSERAACLAVHRQAEELIKSSDHPLTDWNLSMQNYKCLKFKTSVSTEIIEGKKVQRWILYCGRSEIRQERQELPTTATPPEKRHFLER